LTVMGFCLGFFGLGWPQTVILSISISQVAETTSVSHHIQLYLNSSLFIPTTTWTLFSFKNFNVLMWTFALRQDGGWQNSLPSKNIFQNGGEMKTLLNEKII
jgi:hypothetical protein